MAVVEVRHLTKRYGKHTAVDDLSFVVEEKQIYGFLGPNGAGKSTTMNIMTGYLASSEGEVVICGEDMMREPERAKQHIGYLPEVPPVYPDMTVLEYLRFAAELKRIPKADRKEQILHVMELTQVTEVSERLIKNLSKGYRQRVGLAQAILGEPDVLILDEPMVGLDPRQIIEMRDLIKDLGKRHTVILSSHILSEISAVCDRIMIISGGKLIACDSPEGLQGLTQSSFVLETTVKASMEQLRAVLDTMEAVVKVEEKPSQMPDCVTVLIRTKDSVDIREELSVKLYENRLPIMGMNLQEHSLEDIFLELTGKEEMPETGESVNGKNAETENAEAEDADTEDSKKEDVNMEDTGMENAEIEDADTEDAETRDTEIEDVKTEDTKSKEDSMTETSIEKNTNTDIGGEEEKAHESDL